MNDMYNHVVIVIRSALSSNKFGRKSIICAYVRIKSWTAMKAHMRLPGDDLSREPQKVVACSTRTLHVFWNFAQLDLRPWVQGRSANNLKTVISKVPAFI